MPRAPALHADAQGHHTGVYLFLHFMKGFSVSIYQRILVPIDGSGTASKGLDEAIRLAQLTGGKLKLIHVVDELALAISAGGYAGPIDGVLESLRNSGRQILAEASKRATAGGVESDVVLSDNLGISVTDVVLEEAQRWPADLIVIGTHGRRGVRRAFLGSSAETILRASPCPVLLIRAQDEN